MSHFETEAIRTQTERSQFLEHSTPLYLTSSFIFEDAEDMRASFAEEKQRNVYGRYSNPNTSEFVEKIYKMEGAEAGYSFASGMSAVFSTFAALLSSGDHIVSARSVFGSTHGLFTKILPKWNISTSYFDTNNLDDVENKIQPNTKIIYAESPTNPAVHILDLERLGRIAKKHKLLLVIDNCFATPYLQNPIKFGADLVIHSATKLIDGHARINTVKYPFLKSHSQYAIAKKQMKLGGNVVAFEVKGGIEADRKFLNKIKTCSLSANLGDTRTIVTHPASTTHAKLSEDDQLEVGITPGLVRVSVGLEHVQDIIDDLNQALEDE